MSDRSCVVTGSASGIGAAIAARLSADGWAVIGLDVEPGAGTLQAVTGDVGERGTSERAADAAERLAPLRGWVNCAGIAPLESADRLTEQTMRRTLDVNLVGTAWGCSVAVGRMLAGGDRSTGGSIVNVSSVQAHRSMPGTFVYAATKAAVEAMSRQLAVEYADRGIRANAILPGAIATPLNDAKFAAADDPDLARNREAWISPGGRLGTPDEVAACAAWLLGDDASFVSGHSLGVDGAAAVWLTSSASNPDLSRETSQP